VTLALSPSVGSVGRPHGAFTAAVSASRRPSLGEAAGCNSPAGTEVLLCRDQSPSKYFYRTTRSVSAGGVAITMAAERGSAAAGEREQHLLMLPSDPAAAGLCAACLFSECWQGERVQWTGGCAEVPMREMKIDRCLFEIAMGGNLGTLEGIQEFFWTGSTIRLQPRRCRNSIPTVGTDVAAGATGAAGTDTSVWRNTADAPEPLNA
jgi:hypothetical protein